MIRIMDARVMVENKLNFMYENLEESIMVLITKSERERERERELVLVICGKVK